MNDRFRQRIREGEHHSQPVRLYGLKIGAIHRNRFAARMAELLEMAAMPELSTAIEPLVRVRESMRIERKAQDRPLAALSRRDEVTRRLMTVPGIGPGRQGGARRMDTSYRGMRVLQCSERWRTWVGSAARLQQ
jgi:hypothetical protein